MRSSPSSPTSRPSTSASARTARTRPITIVTEKNKELMTAKILDGKAVAAKERQRSAARAADFYSKFGRAPGLAVIKVGDDPASAVYVRNKRKACEECG